MSGVDIPQVRPDDLIRGLRALVTHDAVLGPSVDGGYWAIGLRRAHSPAVRGVPMSTSHTLDAQRERLTALGLRWSELRPLRDVDAFADALAVAEECPRSRFARALGGIEEVDARGDVLLCRTSSRVETPHG